MSLFTVCLSVLCFSSRAIFCLQEKKIYSYIIDLHGKIRPAHIKLTILGYLKFVIVKYLRIQGRMRDRCEESGKD